MKKLVAKGNRSRRRRTCADEMKLDIKEESIGK